ncbi:MAG: hypothetical protein WCV90_06365 [Candidatus Woesearchaeota archaeon]
MNHQSNLGLTALVAGALALMSACNSGVSKEEENRLLQLERQKQVEIQEEMAKPLCPEIPLYLARESSRYGALAKEFILTCNDVGGQGDYGLFVEVKKNLYKNMEQQRKATIKDLVSKGVMSENGTLKCRFPQPDLNQLRSAYDSLFEKEVTPIWRCHTNKGNIPMCDYIGCAVFTDKYGEENFQRGKFCSPTEAVRVEKDQIERYLMQEKGACQHVDYNYFDPISGQWFNTKTGVMRDKK